MANGPGGKFTKGNPGRPKGAKNKSTIAVRIFAQQVLEDEGYRNRVRRMARAGTLPSHLETMLYAYAFGKPKERLEISNPDQIDVSVLVGALTDNEAAILTRALARVKETTE
jgi:hypothetical protein